MAHKDVLGDRLKSLEQVEASRKADPFLPLMCRIDGKGFSKFTKGLDRPFDSRFSALLKETCKFLVEESEALLGYCQSDEITLYWYLDKENNSNREFWFDGKFQKLTSVLASLASSHFVANLPSYLPEKVGKYPAFDARVWSVPDLETAYENFLWRYYDARKNSISMLARSVFSHKSLQRKSAREMLNMLEEKGVIWNSYPSHFRFGSYFKRQRVLVNDFSNSDIPEKYWPTEPVVRTVVSEWNLASVGELKTTITGNPL